jgi:ABC-type nickel/cobalt efflux system permease component RcnA
VYLYAVCFVAVLVTLIAGALAIFGIVRIVAPGVTGFSSASAERTQGIVQLVSTGVLAIAAYGLFRIHWRRAYRLGGRGVEPEPSVST